MRNVLPCRRMVKWKWSLHSGRCLPTFSWSTAHLGVDGYGTWLGASRGNTVLQPDGRTEEQAHDAVWLIPDQQWWVAAFWDNAMNFCTVDICRPASRSGTTWSFVDLELDLYRSTERQAGIVDQDEFAALAAAHLVTEDELVAASETADRLLPLLQEGAEPFDRVARSWLRQISSSR